MKLTRRGVVRAALWTGISAVLPAKLLSQVPTPSEVLVTTCCKVRGLDEGSPHSEESRMVPIAPAGVFCHPCHASPGSGSRNATLSAIAPAGHTVPGRIPPGANMQLVDAITAAFKTGQVATGNE